MSILEELDTLLSSVISVETAVFKSTPYKTYAVLIPLSDSFEYADNKPNADINEVRISLFSKENYIKIKNQLVKIILQADFTITDRRYIGYETETGYHHYVIDVAKIYDYEEED